MRQSRPSQSSQSTRPLSTLCPLPGAPEMLSHHHPLSLPGTFQPLAPAAHPRKLAILAALVCNGPSSTTHNENVSGDHTDDRSQLLQDPVQPQLFVHSFSKHFLSLPGPVL